MTEKNVISIANDFSRYPAGRYKDDGPYSGESFRENYLVPILDGHIKITIKLDGVRGYGSSFLEEAFGGLRRLGYSKEDINNHISLSSEDESLIEEINSYIEHGKDDDSM